MWLYLTDGFFSVVHKPPCEQSELLVRARCREDIQRLAKKLSKDYKFKGNIIESPNADYAYRMIVPRTILATFMAKTIEKLDYDNFKATIPRKDHLRHDAYFDCWEAMYNWQVKLR